MRHKRRHKLNSLTPQRLLVVIKVEAFETAKRPARRPLPAELPRERVVHPAPNGVSVLSAAPTLRKTART